MTSGNQTQSGEEKAWPVNVYRKTSAGWHVLQARNAKGHPILVKATPEKGSILMKRVKLRLYFMRNDEKQKEKGRQIVIRRRDSLLISGSERIRTIVLKFRSQRDCMDFSDRLVTLNPPAVLQTITNNMQKDNDDEAASHTREVLSYMARLINDPDFLGYVHNLESCLSSSEDGLMMLEAVAKSKPSNT